MRPSHELTVFAQEIFSTCPVIPDSSATSPQVPTCHALAHSQANEQGTREFTLMPLGADTAISVI